MLRRKNVRYECTCCGTCCRWEGYVRISSPEVEAIAQYLGMSVETFTATYTRLTDDRQALSLSESPEGACVMLTDGNLCRINPVKPLQCRLFPEYWSFPGFEKLCEVRIISEDD